MCQNELLFTYDLHRTRYIPMIILYMKWIVCYCRIPWLFTYFDIWSGFDNLYKYLTTHFVASNGNFSVKYMFRKVVWSLSFSVPYLILMSFQSFFTSYFLSHLTINKRRTLLIRQSWYDSYGIRQRLSKAKKSLVDFF